MPIKTLNNIVLADFLSVALGPVTSFVSVPTSIAQQIAAVDSDEQLCHIEWLDGHAQLWRIDDWRTSYKREQRKRGLAERERAIHVRASELHAAMCKKVGAFMSQSPSDAENLVNVIIKKRDIVFAKTLGIDITELLSLDDTLQEFKNANNIK